MKFFLEIIIICLLFFGPPICTLFGWSTYGDDDSLFMAIHPIFYFLFLYAILSYNKLIKNKFYLNSTVLILFIFVLVRVLTGQNIVGRFLGNLFVPLLFGFFMEELYKNKKSFKICTNLFLTLFFFEIVLAIVERFGNFLLFPYSLFNPDDINGTVDEGDYFRSNSLLGNPLSNALCVAIVLSFVVVSKLGNVKKGLLILGSFLALLCFNARFATVISVVFFVLYFFSRKISFKNIFSIVIGGGIVAYLILNFSVGDRIVAEDNYAEDDSVAARIDVFEIIDYVDFEMFLYRKGEGIDDLQNKLSLVHVENWILIMVFDLGIIITLYYFVLIFQLSSISLKTFQLKDKLYLFAVFILIASSNNSLATQVPGLSFFIASSYFFRGNKGSILKYVNHKTIFANKSGDAKLKEQVTTAV